MRLSGDQFQRLVEGLVDCFNYGSLARMLDLRLDRNLESIVADQGMDEVAETWSAGPRPRAGT